MQFKHLYLFITLFCTIIISCNNDDKATADNTIKPAGTATPAEDSVEIINAVDSFFTPETINTFSTTAFSDYAKKKSAAINWSKFEMIQIYSVDSPLAQPATLDRKFFDAYGPFLKYSPDSSMFIDLDSYNVDIKKEKNGKRTAIELGPDFEVSLIDLKTKVKMRLIFMGPQGSVEDATWLDNENLVLMGVQNYSDKNGRVTVWKYNVPTNTFFVYEWKDDATAKQLLGYWRTERLKGLIKE